MNIDDGDNSDSILSSSRRRISDLHDSQNRESNGLFVQLQSVLDPAVLPRAAHEIPRREWDSFYTTTRIHSGSPQELSALKARLPPSLAVLDEQTLGYLEADLLDWLFNWTAHKVLTVVGVRGTGKSSLLRHVYLNLLPHVPIESRPTSIFIDLYSWSKDVTSIELALHIIDEVRLIAASEDQSDVRSLQQRGSELRSRLLSGFRGGEKAESRAILRELCLAVLGKRSLQAKALVFVFDNCDQLKDDDVEAVLETVKFLTTVPGVAVNIALRPFVLRTQLERNFDNGAFIWPSISVPPPDLRALIGRRLDYMLDHQSVNVGPILVAVDSGLPIEFSTPRQAIDCLLEFLLVANVQELITHHLCASDLRRALRGIRSLLRSPSLPIANFRDWFIESHMSVGRHRGERRVHHYVVDGVMNDTYEYYREPRPNNESVVANVFDPRGAGHMLAHIAQFRLFTVLDWKGGLVPLVWIRAAMVRLGYSEVLVDRLIERALAFSLVQSPEGELADRCREVRLSASGQYYLNTLFSDPNYIFNVIVDVPLPHALWESTSSHFAKRMSSIAELVHLIAAEERIELATVHPEAQEWYADVLRVHGSCATRVLAAHDHLLKRALNSDKPGVVEEARRLHGVNSEALAASVRRLAVAQLAVGRTKRRAAESSSGRVHAIDLRFGRNGRALLSVPTFISASRQSYIQVSLTKPSEMVDDDISVFVELDNATSPSGRIQTRRCALVTFAGTGVVNPAEQRIMVDAHESHEHQLRGSVMVAGRKDILAEARID